MAWIMVCTCVRLVQNQSTCQEILPQSNVSNGSHQTCNATAPQSGLFDESSVEACQARCNDCYAMMYDGGAKKCRIYANRSSCGGFVETSGTNTTMRTFHCQGPKQYAYLKPAVWTQVLKTGNWWRGRYYAEAVERADGSVLMFGGLGETGYLDDFWVTTDKGDSWTKLAADPPNDLLRTGAAIYALPDNKIVMAAGRRMESYLNDVWQSKDGGQSWQKLADSAAFKPRYGAGHLVFNEKLVLMGGLESHQTRSALNDIWKSEDSGATWTQVLVTSASAPALWSQRWNPAVVLLIDESWLLLGGEYNSSKYLNDVWRSSNHGASWSLVTSAATWSGRSESSAVALADGSVLLVGGSHNCRSCVEVWRAVEPYAAWVQLDPPAWYGEAAAIVAHSHGYLLAIGRLNSNTYYRDDIWKTQVVFNRTLACGTALCPDAMERVIPTFVTLEDARRNCCKCCVGRLKSYKLTSQTYKQGQRRHACQTQFGEGWLPASIQSEEEQAKAEVLVPGNTNIWSGGTYVDGKWKWDDGSDFGYTNWDKAKGVHSTNQPYSCFTNSSSPKGKWFHCGGGNTSYVVMCSKDSRVEYGIQEGHLSNSTSAIGKCEGTRIVQGNYVCSGKNNSIRWARHVGVSNLLVSSRFKLEEPASSSSKTEPPAVFVFWVDDSEVTVNVDVNADVYHIARFDRVSGRLSVSIDGLTVPGMESLPLAGELRAIGWRPGRSTLHIKNLHLQASLWSEALAAESGNYSSIMAKLQELGSKTHPAAVAGKLVLVAPDCSVVNSTFEASTRSAIAYLASVEEMYVFSATTCLQRPSGNARRLSKQMTLAYNINIPTDLNRTGSSISKQIQNTSDSKMREFILGRLKDDGISTEGIVISSLTAEEVQTSSDTLTERKERKVKPPPQPLYMLIGVGIAVVLFPLIFGTWRLQLYLLDAGDGSVLEGLRSLIVKKEFCPQCNTLIANQNAIYCSSCGSLLPDPAGADPRETRIHNSFFADVEFRKDR